MHAAGAGDRHCLFPPPPPPSSSASRASFSFSSSSSSSSSLLAVSCLPPPPPPPLLQGKDREGRHLSQAGHTLTHSVPLRSTSLSLSLCLSASLLSLYAPLLAGQTAMLEGQGKVRGGRGGGALALLVRTNLPPSLPPSPPPESQFSSHGSLWQQPICGGGTLDNITHILCYKTPCYDFQENLPFKSHVLQKGSQSCEQLTATPLTLKKRECFA